MIAAHVVQWIVSIGGLAIALASIHRYIVRPLAALVRMVERLVDTPERLDRIETTVHALAELHPELVEHR